MSDRFEILLRKEGVDIPWQIACPIRISVFQAIEDRRTSDAYLQVKICNVAAERVASFEMGAVIQFEDGSEETFSIDYPNADVLAADSWQPVPIKLKSTSVAAVFLSVSRVEMGSGEVWEEDGGGFVDQQQPVLLSEKAMEERSNRLKEKGLDPSVFTLTAVLGEGYWLCSCGCPNVKRERCGECGLLEETVFYFQDEALLAIGSERRLVAQENKPERTVRTAEQILTQVVKHKDCEAALMMAGVAKRGQAQITKLKKGVVDWFRKYGLIFAFGAAFFITIVWAYF